MTAKKKKPVMAEPVGVGRWWNVRKLPTGEVLLQLEPSKIRLPLLADVGFGALSVGFTYYALRTFSPLLALGVATVNAALNGRSILRRHPTSWELTPGRAVLKGWNGKVRGEYAPARVILMARQHSQYNSTFERWEDTHVSYALFLETQNGKKVAIHRGLPRGDRRELSRAVAEALGVPVVEREWMGIQFGGIHATSWG